MSELFCGRCGNPERLHTPKPQTDDDGFGGETWYHWHPFQPAVEPRKALSLNLDDSGQNFAGVATIRAAMFDVLDRGDHGMPWRFYEEQTESRHITEDAATTDRVLFVDAVIARIAELQNPPHSGVKLENLCETHKRQVLPRPTEMVCGMCEAKRKGKE